MNCRNYRNALVLQAPNRAGEPGDPAELDEHRDSCPACRLFSARYEAAQPLLAKRAASEKDSQPRSGFAASVVAALPERPNPLVWATVRLLPATSALALSLLGWCWLATPTPSELWTQAAEDELLTWVLSENGDDG